MVRKSAPYVHIFRGDKSSGGIRPAASGSASELPSTGEDAPSHRPTTVPPPSGDEHNTSVPRPPTSGKHNLVFHTL